MNRRRWFAASVSSVLVAAGAPGCGTSNGAQKSRVPLPDKPVIVTVTMDEYSFAYSAPVPPGRVVFRFVNEGGLPHQPDLLPLSDGIPPIDQQLRGEERATITPFAGIPPRDPGQVGTYAVDLVPGQRYAFICFARDPDDDESHALQGMSSEFRVPAGAQVPASAPSTTTASTNTTASTTTRG